MTLYNIAEEYRRFMAMVDEGEIPVEAIGDTLDGIEGEFEIKADNIACLIKTMKLEAAAIKAEKDKLSERQTAKENAAKRMSAYLLEQMRAVGKRKLETARNAISVSPNPPSVEIADEQALYTLRPDLFTASVPAPNKTAIKALLKDGEELPGVTLKQGEGLRIR